MGSYEIYDHQIDSEDLELSQLSRDDYVSRRDMEDAAEKDDRARLIAAAPEMLAALVAITDAVVEGVIEIPDAMYEGICEAINKAGVV